MHEASLMKDVMARIQKVAETESAARVTGISVWLGALSHTDAEYFAEHFEHAAAGTIAEGAALDVTVSDDPQHPNAQDILIEDVEVEV